MTHPTTKLSKAFQAAQVQIVQIAGDIEGLLQVKDSNGNTILTIEPNPGQTGARIYLNSGQQAFIRSDSSGVIVIGTGGKLAIREQITNDGGSNNGNVAIDPADDIEMLGNQKGLIVRTSTGARYRINVSDAGAVQATAL